MTLLEKEYRKAPIQKLERAESQLPLIPSGLFNSVSSS
jgi:hypothetical protein